jgi:hypothetical protein
MMKKIITAAAMGALVASSSLAFAADNKGGKNEVILDQNKADPASNPAVLQDDTTGSINSAGGSMLSESDIGAWTSGDYRVVTLSELDRSSSDYTRIKDMSTAQPDMVASTQAAIRANSALSAKLQSENVQIENIVAAEKAADGSVIFYLQ